MLKKKSSIITNFTLPKLIVEELVQDFFNTYVSNFYINKYGYNVVYIYMTLSKNDTTILIVGEILLYTFINPKKYANYVSFLIICFLTELKQENKIKILDLKIRWVEPSKWFNSQKQFYYRIVLMNNVIIPDKYFK